MRGLYVVFGLLFLSCVNKNPINPTDSIEIYYMRPYVNTPFSFSCGMISKAALKDEIHFKEFKDSVTINKFIKIYNNYEIEPDVDGGINTRIKVIVNTKEINDTLCLGENFNTFINGVKYKDNKEMLDFIKEIIDYENTPRPTFPKVKS